MKTHTHLRRRVRKTLLLEKTLKGDLFERLGRVSRRVVCARCLRSAIVLATKQALATVCGLILPQCPGIVSWSAVFALTRRLETSTVWRLRKA